MNQTELTNLVADVHRDDINKTQAKEIVQTVLEAIRNELIVGGEVRLVGFGTFSVKTRAAGEGRNPRTGEKIHIPERRIPGFKAGKDLRDGMNPVPLVPRRAAGGRR